MAKKKFGRNMLKSLRVRASHWLEDNDNIQDNWEDFKDYCLDWVLFNCVEDELWDKAYEEECSGKYLSITEATKEDFLAILNKENCM